MGKNDKNMVPPGRCNNYMSCLFKLGLNHVMGSTSFSFNLKEEDGESLMAKQFSLHMLLQDGFSNKFLKIWDFLSVNKCSLAFRFISSPGLISCTKLVNKEGF